MQPRIPTIAHPADDRTDRNPAPMSRRSLLKRAAIAAGPLAALLVGACDKPYFDRNRGVFVFNRPAK